MDFYLTTTISFESQCESKEVIYKYNRNGNTVLKKIKKEREYGLNLDVFISLINLILFCTTHLHHKNKGSDHSQSSSKEYILK